ncbi:GNAT family N-acetyltransferase [Rhodospirillum sp. A1_3_36]|uniref:GNAT family N-acetyltransferase n=1 Tax=Rhodospirillum sp. A1_3_36 TaxID=3391666 RepID=UPI0039A62CDE
MACTDPLQLDSFEVHLSDIAEASLDDLQTLSMGVGWPHRPNDWRAVLSLGQGVVARDTIGRALGSAMWFPMGNRFATVGMVITSPRMQTLGAGRCMMEVGLEALGKRDLGLNATRSAKRLYLSLGFVPERMVYQHHGVVSSRVSAPLARGDTLRDLGWGDMEALFALDAQAYGAERRHVLRFLLSAGEGIALEREGRIVAYSFVRRFGRGHVVGPVVAANDRDAIAVTGPHLVNLMGQFARVDTREESGPFSSFLLEAGLSVYDTVTTMSRGRPWVGVRPGDLEEGAPQVYGLVNQALS